MGQGLYERSPRFFKGPLRAGSALSDPNRADPKRVTLINFDAEQVCFPATNAARLTRFTEQAGHNT